MIEAEWLNATLFYRYYLHYKILFNTILFDINNGVCMYNNYKCISISFNLKYYS